MHHGNCLEFPSCSLTQSQPGTEFVSFAGCLTSLSQGCLRAALRRCCWWKKWLLSSSSQKPFYGTRCELYQHLVARCFLQTLDWTSKCAVLQYGVYAPVPHLCQPYSVGGRSPVFCKFAAYTFRRTFRCPGLLIEGRDCPHTVQSRTPNCVR